MNTHSRIPESFASLANGNSLHPDELEQAGIQVCHQFDESRLSLSPRVRLEQVRRDALRFREDLLARNQQVRFYRSINLIRAPYPTRYGLYNAAKTVTPYMHILNRLFIIQFDTPEGVKTLLFSPSDIEANRETPFFKRMTEQLGALGPTLSRFLAPVYQDVQSALEMAGIRPDQVDYLSYDHLHTQDIRRWLGTTTRPGLFPKARLLVMKQEWLSTQSLLPPQQDWYCPQGIEGVPPEKVILLEKSVILGNALALVHTPGHTEGNHSLVAHTPDGLLVTSENGVSADSYSPMHSRIPGVRNYARKTGMEVILNGNTQEGGLDQYLSMVMEKTIAGAAKRNPDFFNFVPSSELSAYWGFPGLRPTFSFGELCYGKPQG